MADLPTGEEVIVHLDTSDQNCDYIEFKERFLGVTFNFSNFSYIKETRKLCLNPKKTLENVTANPMMEKIDEERNPVELFDWVAANGKSILKRKTDKKSQSGVGTRDGPERDRTEPDFRAARVHPCRGLTISFDYRYYSLFSVS